MRVFEGAELTIDYFADKSYFKVIRQGKMEISEDDYKSLMLKWAKEIKFYKPTFQLVSYMNYYKPIPPHMQAWIDKNLMGPAFNEGMKKVAFIISRDFYMQVSLEQTMKEKEGKKFKIKYFDNDLDAENWLFEEE